jgi:hypothetical protein
MRLRAPKARPSVRCSVTNELVRAMTYRMYGAFIELLGAAALMLATNAASARSGAAHHGGFASAHSISHPSIARFRHHRRNNGEIVWPGVGDSFYGPNGEPTVDLTQPIPGDIRNTQAYDIPWDWAHRYPPMVTPSDRPYVPSCPTQTVTVHGEHDSTEHTVSIRRCY